MKVLGVIGLPGSGKSLFFDLAKSKGAIVANMGDIIREKAKERGEDTGTTARKLREEHGQYRCQIDCSKDQSLPGRKRGCRYNTCRRYQKSL